MELTATTTTVQSTTILTISDNVDSFTADKLADASIRLWTKALAAKCNNQALLPKLMRFSVSRFWLRSDLLINLRTRLSDIAQMPYLMEAGAQAARERIDYLHRLLASESA